jgi:hypothetical protein
MARALPAGPARRRTFFGLLDANGWGWASLKAFVWFIVIIFLLGYVPDRAYYFTVSRTIELGLLAWSPVNFCPSDPNEGMPCPAPAGAVTPWHGSPPELALPEARVDAAYVQAGTNILLIGGSPDGKTASDSVFVARTVGTGNFAEWKKGPALPQPRRDAGVAFLNGLIYVAGGYDASGKPTNTTFVLKPDLLTGNLGEWQTAEQAKQQIDLPEARAAAPLVALSDGLLLVGGIGPDNKPSKTTWKSKVDAKGALGKWTPQAELLEATADSIAALNGEHVWVLGGRDAKGPTARVQRATIGGETEGPTPSGVPGGAGSGQDNAPGSSGAVGGGVGPDEPGPSVSAAASGSAAGASPGASGGSGGSDAGASPAASAGSGASAGGGAADTSAITRWAVNDAANLPAPRMDAMGFAANGSMYVIGGSDGQQTKREVYWAEPSAGNDGDNIGEWKHLDTADLPDPGRARAAIGQSGATMFAIGGIANNEPQKDSLRTNMSPQEPFFQLGLVGAVVPALKIEGEIGQQLGYLNAAGAWTAMFVLLLLIGWMFAHKEQTRRLWQRMRSRRAHD